MSVARQLFLFAGFGGTRPILGFFCVAWFGWIGLSLGVHFVQLVVLILEEEIVSRKRPLGLVDILLASLFLANLFHLDGLEFLLVLFGRTRGIFAAFGNVLLFLGSRATTRADIQAGNIHHTPLSTTEAAQSRGLLLQVLLLLLQLLLLLLLLLNRQEHGRIVCQVTRRTHGVEQALRSHSATAKGAAHLSHASESAHVSHALVMETSKPLLLWHSHTQTLQQLGIGLRQLTQQGILLLLHEHGQLVIHTTTSSQTTELLLSRRLLLGLLLSRRLLLLSLLLMMSLLLLSMMSLLLLQSLESVELATTATAELLLELQE
mmetsp:Transcript_20784/g.57457  ORF Transcript_20784/g.57457 Transcript_20784/m.57457 type:complete len:319 (-) Transcript_20784:653-1609(-)